MVHSFVFLLVFSARLASASIGVKVYVGIPVAPLDGNLASFYVPLALTRRHSLA